MKTTDSYVVTNVDTRLDEKSIATEQIVTKKR